MSYKVKKLARKFKVDKLKTFFSPPELTVRQEGFLKKVQEETGWSRKKALKKMLTARKQGISFMKYANRYVFQLSDEQVKEFAKALKAENKRLGENREFYVEQVCLKSGWSREKAIADMNAAKKRGVTYLKYTQKNMWQDERREKKIANVKKEQVRIDNNSEMYLNKIMEETGWSRGKTELEVLKARSNCGSSYEDFYLFKFQNKTPEEQAKYVTMGMFNKMRIKYNNHKSNFAEFNDKAKFNSNFRQFVKHSWFENRNMTYDEFLKNIEGLDKVIVKPLTATQGKGIQVFSCNVSEEENRKLYEELMGMKRSIVEEYIIQNKEIAGFGNTSVNTVRIMTLNFNGECKILHGSFRIGIGGVVDNFHAGGIIAGVDVKTGIVETKAIDLNGNLYEKSPTTGKDIVGFKIPFWNEILDACQAMYDKYDKTKLVGWDFAILDDGVDLIEGNPGASYMGAQISYVEENKGLAQQMALPYL